MRGFVGRELRLAWTAVTVLTRLPSPRLAGFRDEWLPRSVPYFPLVGLLIGGLAAAVYFLAALAWPQPVPAVLAVAAAAIGTGALHEDGWADVFDALGAGGDRNRRLEVMRDSQIGAWGALALLLLIAAKLACLAALPPERVPAALVGAHVLARWSSLPLLRMLPYARDGSGQARPFAGRISGRRLLAGTVVAMVLTASSLGLAAFPAWAVALLSSAVVIPFFRRRFGGMTGDTLGAANQLVEVTVFLILTARLAPPP